MFRKGIDGTLDRHILLQRTDMLHKHVGVKCLGMVVVQFRTLFVGQLGVSLVVIVVAERRDIVILERLLQPFDKGALAGTRPAGNTDYRYIHI